MKLAFLYMALICSLSRVDNVKGLALDLSIKKMYKGLKEKFTAEPDSPFPKKFTKDFSKPMAIPEEGIAAAVEVMRSGRLFRYSATSAETSQVSMAEKEFAEMIGSKYSVAVNSCSSAILLAMKSVGVEAGDKVITNGFTFTALPSTIMRIGAEPVLVEASMQWTMSLTDLEKKLDEHRPKVLLLSHMRGKVCDMEKVVELCETYGATLIEDCAHGCGVEWKGKQLGYHGKVACYSTQSDKVINSGEGGFITTNDDQIAANLIYMSGCYERRYNKHMIKPDPKLLEVAMVKMPNLSSRMNEITAACVRPLIKDLPQRIQRYNKCYKLCVDTIEKEAGDIVCIPKQDERVTNVGDHLNFYLKNVTPDQNGLFNKKCSELGLTLGWFTSDVNARYYKNWHKYGTPEHHLPNTDKLLSTGYDMKMPPHFEESDFVHVGKIIAAAANYAVSANE